MANTTRNCLWMLVLACALGACDFGGAGNDIGRIKPRFNVLIIAVHGMRFTDAGTFGGEISTPTLDQLAANGVRLSSLLAERCEQPRYGEWLRTLRGTGYAARGFKGSAGAANLWLAGVSHEQPFVAQVAYNLDADDMPENDARLEHYSELYRGGYELLADTRFSAAVGIGVLRPTADREAAARSPRWYTLDAATQDAQIMQMATWAVRLEHVDTEIQRLLAGLDASTRLSDTMVIVHGAPDGQCGMQGAANGSDTSALWQLAREAGSQERSADGIHIRIPAIIWWPGRASGLIDSAPHGLDALLVTMADFLGAQPPDGLNAASMREHLERFLAELAEATLVSRQPQSDTT